MASTPVDSWPPQSPGCARITSLPWPECDSGPGTDSGARAAVYRPGPGAMRQSMGRMSGCGSACCSRIVTATRGFHDECEGNRVFRNARAIRFHAEMTSVLPRHTATAADPIPAPSSDHASVAGLTRSGVPSATTVPAVPTGPIPARVPGVLPEPTLASGIPQHRKAFPPSTATRRPSRPSQSRFCTAPRHAIWFAADRSPRKRQKCGRIPKYLHRSP